MNSGDWKNDPRLAGMDPVKLQYIEKIAAQVSARSKSGRCPEKSYHLHRSGNSTPDLHHHLRHAAG